MRNRMLRRIALVAATGSALAGCYYAPPPPPAYAYAPAPYYAPGYAYYPGYYYGPPVVGSVFIGGRIH
jgi:hypothetical protein